MITVTLSSFAGLIKWFADMIRGDGGDDIG
jgi:hypothetical protein